MTILMRWKINKIIKKIKAMKHNRKLNQPSDDVIKKEVAYYFELAQVFKQLKGHKKYPHSQIMVIECYRAAADLDNAQAHFELGQYFLDEAKYREVLDSQAVFNSKANLIRCKQVYEEAHVHLQLAENFSHIAAKRLRGLCFINGWGVDVDKEKGFDLVVASIDQEGSWDKLPQIFAEIGLNKPEFFTEIIKHRKKT